MLIRVHQGERVDDIAEPGSEVWAAEIADLTSSALQAALVPVRPGEWYPFEEFKTLISDNQESSIEDDSYATVLTTHPGVDASWSAAIEVGTLSAALMVCKSTVEHVERMKLSGKVWVWIE